MNTTGTRASTKDHTSHINFSEFHEIDQKLITDIPLEQEHQIHNVLAVVRETIEKLKISLILPQIFESEKLLQKYIKDTEYENCLKLVKEYRDKWKTSSDEPPKTDYHLKKIIDYFHENCKILTFLPNWLDDIDKTEKTLLKSFEDLYQVAQERFFRSALADLAKEKRLHEVYLANENVKKDINELTQKIKNKNFHYLWKFAAKSGVIKKLEDELAFHKYHNNIYVRKEIAKSNQEIQKINIVCAAKQRELEEELEKSYSLYEKTLKDNLLQEKNARDEKNKLQLQLEALIKKYDQTIFDKYKEEISLQEEYEKQKHEFDEFMIVYNNEEALYNENVLKKEEEYNRLHEAKILLFTHTRAAKKIQRWWKKYFRKQKKLKKLERKNKKGDKGVGKAVENKPKGRKGKKLNF